MSIFEYDKEEEEQKLQATYEKIGEKRGEKQGELKKAWLKRIKIGSAVSSTECYCGTFLYLSAILAG